MEVGTLLLSPPAEQLDMRLGKKFIDTLFADARHKALYGGRGSGKSWSVATYLVMTAARLQKRIICARQYQNSIRDSSKELIERRISDMRLSAQFGISDRYIHHAHTRSQFLFMGLERNVESIRSLEGADIVWIEEARTISAKSMEVLLPTIRKPGSELIWTWNPVESTDPVDAYFRNGPPPPRSIVTRVSYEDNPFFKRTEMPAEMELLRTANPSRYRHVWLGDYDVRHESKVFPNVQVGRIEIPRDCPPVYGMDFGFGSDPSAIVKAYVVEPTRQIYITAENVGRYPMERLPDMIRDVVHDDDDLIRCDSSQPGTIEYLQGRGLNVTAARKGPGSVKSGIQFLQGFEITIDPSCEEMCEEARLYQWNTERLTGRILNTPRDAYNHTWDALRYAVEEIASAAVFDAADPTDNGVLSLKLW